MGPARPHLKPQKKMIVLDPEAEMRQAIMDVSLLKLIYSILRSFGPISICTQCETTILFFFQN